MFNMFNLSLVTNLLDRLYFFIKKLNILLFLGVIFLVILWSQIPFTQAISLSTPAVAIGSEAQNKTIVEVVVANGSLKTFLAGLRAARLVETLIGEGPFTVFAPSDAAFAALGRETVKDLFEPEDRDKLIKVLNYHIVPGKIAASDLKSGDVKTLAGNSVKIKVIPSIVMVNDAKVVRADIQAQNGIVHVIDKVMLPPEL